MMDDSEHLGLPDLDRTIGANVKRGRERLGWSQAALAVRLNEYGLESFHQTTVARVERGERPLRAAEAVAVARALETTFDALAEANDAAELRDLDRGLRDRLRQFDEAAVALVRERWKIAAHLDQVLPTDQTGQIPSGGWVQSDALVDIGAALWQQVLESSLPKLVTSVYARELDTTRSSSKAGRRSDIALEMRSALRDDGRS